MSGRPKSQSKAWYRENKSPKTQKVISKGLGLSLERFKELLPAIYERGIEIKHLGVDYRKDSRRLMDNAKELYNSFKEHFAPTPEKWKVYAMKHLMLAAHLNKSRRKYPKVRSSETHMEAESSVHDTPFINDESDDDDLFSVSEESDADDEVSTKEAMDFEEEHTPAHSLRSQRPLLSPLLMQDASVQTIEQLRRPSPRAFTHESMSSSHAASQSAIDPSTTPLTLNLYATDEATDTEECVGVFSTRFLCRFDRPLPQVSFDLLKRAIEDEHEEFRPVTAVLLDQWSGSNIPIQGETMLNTAIYTILEQGVTTASLRLSPLDYVKPTDGRSTNGSLKTGNSKHCSNIPSCANRM